MTTYTRELAALLDEQAALIDHYQRREARRVATRKALRDFAGLLLGLGVWAGAIAWAVLR